MRALAAPVIMARLFSDHYNLYNMKTSGSTNNMQSKKGHSHKLKPEIRDDLDSHCLGINNSANCGINYA